MASAEMPNPSKPIPFSLFISLLSDISKVATKTRDSGLAGPSGSKNKDHPALRIFSRWVAYLRRTFQHGTVEDSSIAIFQLLFPELDVNRRYDMQEARLAQHLARVFGISSNSGGRGSRLSRWMADGSSGCLGAEVREVLAVPTGASDQGAGLDIIQVNKLLTQLASFSSFSHSNIKQDPNLPSSRVETLKILYSSLSPTEASFLTQVILKDLRPVLYPSKEMHYTAALKNQKSNSVVHLDVVDALKVWDPTFRALSRWRVVSSFEVALSIGDHGLVSIGHPLQIPKTVKGTGCARALKLFSNSRLVWAETKYDGERAQIHVKVDQDRETVELKIFSKSKRESTNDRFAIHQVIVDALGLPGSAVPSTARNGMRSTMSDVILEAEMVAFSDATERIDEFWRIRSLIESTAVGSRHKIRKMPVETPAISQFSLRSNASDGGTRHLALVFFDVLLLDSRPLTGLPYCERRKIMESIVLPISGFSMLAERSPIDMDSGIDGASAHLKSILAQNLADHQEGLVLKADEGAYIKSPWVKLKKDYIPGLGDCVDLVIIGACWEKDRGRELRVPPSAFTTFHLGMLTNADVLRDDPSTTPSFRAFFSTSYGLSRDQLEDLNFQIKSANSMTYDEYRRSPHRLGYDMSLYTSPSQPKPSVILLRDSLILAEVFGAGFTKAPGGKYYELRFPRMTKTYRRHDRAWPECISLEEFQRIAREAVGRDRPNKETDDWCKNLFGNVASPGVKDPLRRRQREKAIFADLERIERGRRDGNHKSKDHNSRKRKRTVDSSSCLPEYRRPPHGESTYPENLDRVIEGSPLKHVALQRGPVSPVSPVTPTRPGLSRRLAPLGSMTNVATAGLTTPPKLPLDGKGQNRFGFGDVGKRASPKTRLSHSPNPFVDYEGGGRFGLNINPFKNPPRIPPLLPSLRAISHQTRMDPHRDESPHSISNDLRVNIDVQLTTEQTTPLAPQTDLEHPPQAIAGRSLPTPVSNGPVKRGPPPASPHTVMEAEVPSIGVKRARNQEDAGPPSKKTILTRKSPSVQKVPGSSRDLKPSGTWGPDETTFMMEAPHSSRDVSKLKTKSRKGDMSVDAIKARLIRATSTLQVIPSKDPDTTVEGSTAVIDTFKTRSARTEERIVGQKTLEAEVEPVRQKPGLSTSTLGIPAPFPPGTSGPGSSLEHPNNSDKIAAYHGADRFYSGRPPSATPQHPPEVFGSTNGDKKSLVQASGEVTKQEDVSTRQPGQQKPEDSRMALGRLPSFILGPQQLLFADTAVGALMSTSVVWFARGIHDPEPAYRPSSLQLIPRMNEVSKLESLLAACGWHCKKSFTSKRGIDRGVVFVDYEEQTDVQPAIKTHWAVQQCENAHRLATQYQTVIERGMKSIWIMDAKVLRWEKLRAMKSRDPLDVLEEFVLWKKA